MTKELKLEECVNLLSSGPSSGFPKKPTEIPLPNAGTVTGQPISSVVSTGAISTLSSTPGSSYQSSFHSPPPSKMIRRSSKNDLRGGLKCTIRLLDDNEILQSDFQSHHKGQFLMDFVCRQLNIAEKDYFGLRYVDSNKQRHWLDLGKSIIKQLKDNAYILCFRLKFYPNDPMLLKEEVSRYQLVLQLRRDILHGRLYSALSDMGSIVSFILQSELGDFDPDVHTANYAAEYELVARQTPELEAKATELHQKLRGITPSEADILFLKKVSSLDTYGVDPHPVKDQQGEQVYLGINHTGISTFQGSKKSTHFKWSQISKLNYEAKMFIIHLSIAEDSRIKKKETVGFKCQTSSACKYLWRCAVEQRLFFNCGCATEIPNAVRGGGIFGSRFRYHGRVQREILEDPGPLRASDAVIQRTPLYRSLQRNKTRSLPHSPSHLGYGSLPRSNHSAPPNDVAGLDGTIGSSASLPLSTLSSPYCPEHTLPILETLQEDSPRAEDKGMGDGPRIGLVRSGSIRSTSSAISLDEPDLTFLQNRNVSLLTGGDMYAIPSDALLSITEELEDETGSNNNRVDSLSKQDKDGATNKKIGNGHSYQVSHVPVGNDSDQTVPNESSAFAPVYNPSDESGKMNDDKVLRDSKIDQISAAFSSGKPRNSILAIWKIFMVCFMCVLVSLLFVAIMVIELDVDFCRRMRNIPEVEYFQFEVYEPFKFYMREKLHGIQHFK